MYNAQTDPTGAIVDTAVARISFFFDLIDVRDLAHALHEVHVHSLCHSVCFDVVDPLDVPHLLDALDLLDALVPGVAPL